eukprot:g14106.t1
MGTYLSEHKWSIGYLDSGWGSVFDLFEAKIQNKDGYFVTHSPEGIAAAADEVASGGLPANHQSWHNVSLVNQPGPTTWPMCVFSYIFMRADQTTAGDTGALLDMFVRFLLSAEGQELSKEFAFVPVPDEVQAINQAGLSLITLAPGIIPYQFEGASTVLYEGAKDHYVSEKRRGYLYDATTRLRSDVKELQEGVFELEAVTNELKMFEEVLELHGSGTTNPSDYIWRVMGLLESRLQSPTKLTYRGIGSGNGISEFLVGANAFGMGDIPLTSAQHASLNNETVLQIPFVVGGVSVFHNAVDGLVLDAPTLAKIFSRQITRWDHPNITNLNPNLQDKLQGQNITIVHRKDSSSSTTVFTSYLKAAAPTVWTLGAGSKLNTWPTGAGVVPLEGSFLMGTYLSEHKWSIGYLDSGWGSVFDLFEAKIQNKDGYFVTHSPEGIAAAADEVASGGLPANHQSWHNVSLVNQPGPTTWPMCVFSYIFMRADQTTAGDTGALLDMFVRFLLSAEGQELSKEFAFVPVPDEVQAINQAGLSLITLAPGIIPYQFEGASTVLYEGAKDHYVSEKRRGYLYDATTRLRSDVKELQEGVFELEAVTNELKMFEEVLELHGSGTTNPSDYIWRVMGLLESRLQSPTKLTYRGIGSGNGISEFLVGANAFGMGDIPLTSAQHASLNNETVLQIPFVVGGVSVFHNAVDGLVLDAPTLAKIFSRQITRWDHPNITNLNPNLQDKLQGQNITIVHRKDSSSSTTVFTSYLKAAAPTVWTLGAGSKLNTWPTGAGVVPLEGSFLMGTYLSEHKWSIGYLDSGWGSVFDLFEAKIQNKDGYFVTHSPEGIAAAADEVASGGLPANHQSWHNVSLVNQPGPTTWPMCVFSYIFMRADQTTAGDTGALLDMFVRFLLSAEGQELSKEFAFVPAGLSLITLAPGIIPYQFEGASTVLYEGAKDHYVSEKRRGYLYDATTRLRSDVKELQEDMIEVRQFEEVQVLHGSGTTNPSKYIWYMVDLMEARLSSPSKLTYRAVGSGTGKTEFIANVNGFGCADVPLFAEDEAKLVGQVILQFPFVIGGVSVFHSGVKGLRFTPSLLARVFSTDINKWDHPDIIALNSDLANEIPKGQSIKVVHRDTGSSSTFLLTNYLKATASADWSLGAGTTITWPNTTFSAEGSQGVTAFIQNNPWSIGYLDSGFGQDAGLAEVRLKNFNGNYVTSEDPEGILAALTQVVQAGLPNSQGSWKDVSLINLPGENTWPMCAFSYLFVRADQTKTGEAGALLKALVEFILSREGQNLVRDFSFLPVGPEVEAVNALGIKLMTFEPGSYPLHLRDGYCAHCWGCSKRSSAAQTTKADMALTINKLQAQIKAMEMQALTAAEGKPVENNEPRQVAIAALRAGSAQAQASQEYQLRCKTMHGQGRARLPWQSAGDRAQLLVSFAVDCPLVCAEGQDQAVAAMQTCAMNIGEELTSGGTNTTSDSDSEYNSFNQLDWSDAATHSDRLATARYLEIKIRRWGIRIFSLILKCPYRIISKVAEY